MRLADAQVAEFERDGFLLLPGLFSEEEVEALRSDLPRVFALDRAEVPRTSTGEKRLAHRLERYSEPFARLLRHPRMVGPAVQLLGGPVYSHQYKVVTKASFGALDFPWHQDYATWHVLDGMPEPKAMNFALFLDDVTEFNGPITFIPGSHRGGVEDGGVEPLDGSSDFHALAPTTIERLVTEGGLVAPKGKAGTGLFFHGCLAHASAPNLSPWPRRNVYSSLNRVDNFIRRPTRPEFYANRDFTPIEPLADDCLLELARANRAA
jgi:ectoine hydroxylase